MRLSHDDYYLQMLGLLAQRATCARRSVAAILVDRNHRVLSTGYNGVPRTFPHCKEDGVHCPGALDAAGDTRRCMAVHAEVNAMLQCARLDEARTIYVSCTPCFSCAKMICNTSITRVICLEPYADELGQAALDQAGIKVVIMERRC